MLLEKNKRHFLSEDFDITKWETLEPVFKNLIARELVTESDFTQWLKDWDELNSALEEEYAWCYIKMTIDTTNRENSERYGLLVSEISPKLSPLSNDLNKKLVECPFVDSLKGEAFEIWLKGVRTSIDLFREENIQLNADIQVLTQKYSTISGSLEVDFKGEKLTMPAAGKLLQSSDREIRESIYNEIAKVRLHSKDEINTLFNQLVHKRNEVAKNAGFLDFRDYKFTSLGRFDFTKEDCFSFHESISTQVVPIVNKLYREKKQQLGVSELKPWDTSAIPAGQKELEPFSGPEELIEKSINVFSKIDPYFSEALIEMKKLGHLDLASKPGKSPGGYNYPLYETGAPFIFMNAVGTPRDLVTMMHEGGHAVHSFLTHSLSYSMFKSCPSEVAELASMSMELMSMDYWDEFYANEEDLKRAKKEHLEDSIMALPWIAMVDKFQHWIYENPNHSIADREKEWLAINNSLATSEVNWEGEEENRLNTWQKQLHIFELPFYYIEYGMAQLGAIAIWKSFKENSQKTVERYKEALSLGYTKSVPEIYKTAGIRFDFSEKYIKELMDFMQEELAKI